MEVFIIWLAPRPDQGFEKPRALFAFKEEEAVQTAIEYEEEDEQNKVEKIQRIYIHDGAQKGIRTLKTLCKIAETYGDRSSLRFLLETIAEQVRQEFSQSKP